MMLAIYSNRVTSATQQSLVFSPCQLCPSKLTSKSVLLLFLLLLLLLLLLVVVFFFGQWQKPSDNRPTKSAFKQTSSKT